MTARRLGTIFLAGLVAVLAGVSCVDVGHESETGCLADMSQPGCNPSSASSGSGGAGGAGGGTAGGGGSMEAGAGGEAGATP